MTTYTVILSQEPLSDGTLVWGAFCPAMPGMVTVGDTREEALSEMAAIMPDWIEVPAEEGEAPLAETPELIAEKIELVLEARAMEGLPLIIETTVLAPVASVAA